MTQCQKQYSSFTCQKEYIASDRSIRLYKRGGVVNEDLSTYTCSLLRVNEYNNITFENMNERLGRKKWIVYIIQEECKALD